MAGSEEGIGGLVKLGDLLFTERMSPSLRVVFVIIGLPYCRALNLLGKVLVRMKEVVEGRMLARSLEAVGENAGVDGLLLSLGGVQVRGLRGRFCDGTGSHCGRVGGAIEWQVRREKGGGLEYLSGKKKDVGERKSDDGTFLSGTIVA